jgi:tRNA pseudouridine38-40 synthase
MPRFRILVAYDGTDFHGWQRQEPPGREPLRTVQGVLEEAARDAFRMPMTVVGASRTDAGVHAIGQVASFATETRIPVDRLCLALMSRLPRDITVSDARVVRDDFDPISDAVSKSYRYSIAVPTPDRRPIDVFERRFTTEVFHRLDVDRMQAAAQILIGEHDFAAFAHVAHGKESTVRRIHACRVSCPAPGRIHIDVAGGGFLYNMVRIIAGTLVDVGRGRTTTDDVRAALASRDRTKTGQTLPPQGLCLRWIHYADRDRSLLDAASARSD